MHCPAEPSPAVLLNVPSKQGSGADAPSAQNDEGEHSKHEVMPLSFMKRPASHLLQSSKPVSFAIVPARQSFGWLLPPAHAVPAGQAVQFSALVTLSAAYVPGLHAIGILKVLPCGQLKPASHTLQAVLPASSW